MLEKNNAEYLVKTINGQRFYNKKKLRPSEMVWKCTADGCTAEPKIRLRSAYKDRIRCNACSNKEKAKDKKLIEKRNEKIKLAYQNEELRKIKSEISKKINSNPEIRKKLSEANKKYYREHPELKEAMIKRAKKNNKITGFGTPDFGRAVHLKRSQAEKQNIVSKIARANKITGRQQHMALLAERFSSFKLLNYTGLENTYQCNFGHVFNMLGNNFLKRGNCPNCSPKTKLELNVEHRLAAIQHGFQRNRRVLFLSDDKNGNNALEIDFYHPDLNFGIEIHGVWSHSEQKHEKLYHKNKKELADKWGIKLLQFFEDDINHKWDIVESIIKAKLGKHDKMLGARELEIKEVSWADADAFLESNHLQGKCRSFLRLGLFDKNGLLVSLLTIRKFSRNKKYKNGNFCEIARFCNKKGVSVRGGFSRLLKYAENLLVGRFDAIYTYADLAYSDGNLYLSNGFELVGTSEPQMWWGKSDLRYPRQKFWGQTDKSIRDRGFFKVYGVGNLIFKKPLLTP